MFLFLVLFLVEGLAVAVEVCWEFPDAKMRRPFVPIAAVRVGEPNGLASNDWVATQLLQKAGDPVTMAVCMKLLRPFHVKGAGEGTAARFTANDDPVDAGQVE